MAFLKTVIDFFLHLDVHLASVISDYGTWTYGILFLVIFCETGLVVTPFLPGDSLLFAAGAFAALGSFNPLLLGGLLMAASILGDNANYFIGRHIGARAFSGKVRYVKMEYLDRTRGFYARHGGKTIIMARFVPIIRTFAPFVAGVGKMEYPRFLAYSVAGAFCWVGIGVGAGYFFGNIPVVKANFTLVILGIIAVSVSPVMWHAWKTRTDIHAETRRHGGGG